MNYTYVRILIQVFTFVVCVCVCMSVFVFGLQLTKFSTITKQKINRTTHEYKI